MNPPTWAKNATPPPFAEALNSPKLASMSWYKNHSPRKIQAGIRTRKDREDPRPDSRPRVEHEVGAQHGGDGAAGAQLRYPRLSGRAEQQGHRGLRHHRGEAASEVEDEVQQRPEDVLDVLSEDRQEQHVAQDVIPATMQKHGSDPAEAPRRRPVTGVVERARVERGVVDRRVELREL
jgi:hypothetical protein